MLSECIQLVSLVVDSLPHRLGFYLLLCAEVNCDAKIDILPIYIICVDYKTNTQPEYAGKQTLVVLEELW